MFTVFTVLQITMYRKKVQRNMFWHVTFTFLLGNFLFILSLIFLGGVYDNCMTSSANKALNTYTAFFILTFNSASLLLNCGIWYLVYKYWEVSWTVPLHNKGEQVSQRMQNWLKFCFITGLASYLILMVV
jgi:hypothetical protein